VINMSWGSRAASPVRDAFFAFAASNYDAVMVCAAGNERAEPIIFPAAYEETLAVGAASFDDLIPGTSIGSELDLAAPTFVVTTDVTGEPGSSLSHLSYYWPFINGVYSEDYEPFYRGTSAAAPHVSGAIALMLSLKPGLSPLQVRKALHASAEKVHPTLYNYNWDSSRPGHSEEMGYGRLRVDQGLAEVGNLPTVELLTPTPGVEILIGQSLSIQWTRQSFQGPLHLELYNSRGFVAQVATNLTGSSYTWSNPGTLVTDHDYRLKLSSMTQEEIFDFSDRAFSLEGVMPIQFVDSNLQRKLIQLGYDSNNDQRIDVVEAAAIVTLDISQSEITDLSGLEYFNNMRSLNCANNLIRDMSPVFYNAVFMERCDKSISFGYNLLNLTSPVSVCELACSTWRAFKAEPQLAAFNCLCWNPSCPQKE